MSPTPEPPYDIHAWRARIPLLRSMIPMNNCSQAPQSDATRAAAERYLDSWNRSGMDWESWMEEVRLAKRAFARLIGATERDIAIFSSVSEATSAVASALDLHRSRRVIVTTDAEFPTVGHVWLAQRPRGADVRWVPVREGVVDPADYERAIDDDTRLVSACHAYYLDGFTQDLERLGNAAHACGALFFVDAYQSLGIVPVDVARIPVDFLVAGNLKFLMGVPGIAFMYVRPDIADLLEPTVTGWFGRANPFAFDARALDWSAGASRFDAGTPPIINAYIARAGMEMIAEVGVGNIRAWHEVLGRRLIDGGRARGLRLCGPDGMGVRTATTAFVVDDSHAVEDAMRQRGVVASARGSVIRLAPHFYSTLDDVDAALDALASVCGTA